MPVNSSTPTDDQWEPAVNPPLPLAPDARGDTQRFEQLLRVSCRALNAPRALLTRLDDRSHAHQVIATIGVPSSGSMVTDLAAPYSLAGEVVARGEPLDLVGEEPGADAYLGVPLRTERGDILGTLAVTDGGPRSWSAGDRALLRDLAAMAARELTAHTQRPAQEAELERHRLAAVLDAIGEAVIIADPNGTISFWNQAAERLYGWQAGEVRGRNILDVTPSDAARERAEEIMARLRRGERWTGEFRVRRRDGSDFPALVTDAPIWTSDGLTGIVGVSVDLSSQKHVEARLREEAQLIETLHDTGILLGAELDLQKLVQAVTDASTRLTGAAFGAFFYNVVDEQGESYTLYTLSGASVEDFERFPMPRNTAIFGPTFRGEGIIRLDDVTEDPRYGRNPPYYGMPEGHLPVRSYLAVPVVTRGGEVLGGLFFGHPRPGVFSHRAERLAAGIAAQAAIAIENARLFKLTQEAAHAREEFLAIAAHELKTPLTSIKGFADLLDRQLARPAMSSERLQRYTDQLRTQIARLELLVGDLLDVSRLHRGALGLRYEEGDLAALAAAVLERFRETPGQYPAHQLVLDGVAKLHGTWDLGRLDQVLTNLISNAVKYSPLGGEVRVTVYDRGEEAVLEVRDQGIGIAEQDLSEVFQPFMRSGEASDTAGSGLGLYITRHIVERHGGHITVASQPAIGTIFTVHLPRFAPQPEREDGATSPG